MDGKLLAKIVAKAIFYASIQSSIASVEMSSKFSVMNFSKDQLTLQRAADALRSYIWVGCLWAMGTVMALYASHGPIGALIGLVANVMMMMWTVVSYTRAFKKAAKDNNLKTPTVWNSKDTWVVIGVTVGVFALTYLVRMAINENIQITI